MDTPAFELDGRIREAAKIVANAQALLITAGAGMGVDSGLPDFRGPEGFWRAYPAYRRLGVDFASMANPRHFRHDPSLAWGFYGHRSNLYRATQPHDGFSILKRWGEQKSGGYGVFTSNVDGQFQRAGFDEAKVTEVHGSIHFLQCVRECGAGIFSADGTEVQVSEDTMRAEGALPCCPACGELARPNILMFGDLSWDPSRSAAQEERLMQWLEAKRGSALAVVELGAGGAIPTVRVCSEDAVEEFGARLVRVNLREAETPTGQVGLPLGAREALEQIDRYLTGQ